MKTYDVHVLLPLHALLLFSNHTVGLQNVFSACDKQVPLTHHDRQVTTEREKSNSNDRFNPLLTSLRIGIGDFFPR